MDEGTEKLLDKIDSLTSVVETLQSTINNLVSRLAERDAEIAEYRRVLFGHKSERLP